MLKGSFKFTKTTSARGIIWASSESHPILRIFSVENINLMDIGRRLNCESSSASHISLKREMSTLYWETNIHASHWQIMLMNINQADGKISIPHRSKRNEVHGSGKLGLTLLYSKINKKGNLFDQIKGESKTKFTASADVQCRRQSKIFKLLEIKTKKSNKLHFLIAIFGFSMKNANEYKQA